MSSADRSSTRSSSPSPRARRSTSTPSSTASKNAESATFVARAPRCDNRPMRVRGGLSILVLIAGGASCGGRSKGECVVVNCSEGPAGSGGRGGSSSGNGGNLAGQQATGGGGHTGVGGSETGGTGVGGLETGGGGGSS